MGHRVRCSSIRISRTGLVVSVAENCTLLSCGVCDRDTILLESNTSTGSTSQSSASTAMSASAAPGPMATVNEDMEVASPDEPSSTNRYFVDCIARSSLIPCSSLEALALASHSILLQMGFVCISERPDPNAVPGFAPPLSGTFCLILFRLLV
jgi:hypothetical protein